MEKHILNNKQKSTMSRKSDSVAFVHYAGTFEYESIMDVITNPIAAANRQAIPHPPRPAPITSTFVNVAINRRIKPAAKNSAFGI